MYNKSPARQSGTLSIIGTTKSIKLVLGEQNVTFRLMQKARLICIMAYKRERFVLTIFLNMVYYSRYDASPAL